MSVEIETKGPWIICMGDDYSSPRTCVTWAEVEELKAKAYYVTGGNVPIHVISIPYALMAPDLVEALKDTDDQAAHADNCPWWNHAIHKLGTPEGRDAADADCNCFVKSVRAAVANIEGAAS